MIVSISNDKPTMGKKAAAVGAEFIRKAIAERGTANVVLACAPSQNQTYDALIAEPGIDWSKVSIFHLDEYIGLTDKHPASFRLNLHKTILDRLPQKPRKFHPIQGDAADPEKTIADLGDKIDSSDKSDLESRIADLKEALKGTSADDIKAKQDALQKAFYAVSEKIYKQQAPQGDASAQGGYQDPNAGAQGGDGYYDADFNVKNDN